jgi:two-component system, chemotaxis family, protein-glutamate methylesterase/glutaminase
VPTHDIIVLGASSGGIESLAELVSGLPQDLAASVFIVVHVPARAVSLLPEILTRAGRLPAAHAIDGESVQQGRIYIAPPDFHLLLRNGSVRLLRGPRENNHRPAVDPLFRSAARAYGPRVVGVVLSGALDDGTAGLVAVKTRGGTAIVQDPADALFPDMPRNAMEVVDVDHCLPKSEIAALLVRLSKQPVKESAPSVTDEMEKETDIEAMDMDTIQDEDKPGVPSVFGCPDCGGTLWEMEDGELLRFRCRIGHAFGAEGLLSAQSESLDNALWTAFRALEENASLARRLAARARKSKRNNSARVFEERARSVEEQAKLIHNVLLSGKFTAGSDKPDETP